MSISRRTFLNSALALGAGASLGSSLFSSEARAAMSPANLKAAINGLQGGNMTATSWGGAYQEAQRNAWFSPFAQAAGITVNEDTDPSNAKIIAMVKNNNVTWDVCDVGLEQAHPLGKDGYLEPIDYSIVDKADFPAGFATEYGIGNITWSTVLAYREDNISGGKPASVADVWDKKRFPGKRTLRDYPVDNIPWALMAAGVPKNEIYPITDEKLKMAFKKLDEIKNDVIWWTAGAQPAQLIASKEVTLAQAWNGRLSALMDDGIPVNIVWEGAHMQVDAWVVPKNAPNKDVAMLFIAWASQPLNNAAISAEIAYGPVNMASIPHASNKYEAILPTTHFDNHLICDFNWWGPNFKRVNEMWQEWKLT